MSRLNTCAGLRIALHSWWCMVLSKGGHTCTCFHPTCCSYNAHGEEGSVSPPLGSAWACGSKNDPPGLLRRPHQRQCHSRRSSGAAQLCHQPSHYEAVRHPHGGVPATAPLRSTDSQHPPRHLPMSEPSDGSYLPLLMESVAQTAVPDKPRPKCR